MTRILGQIQPEIPSSKSAMDYDNVDVHVPFMINHHGSQVKVISLLCLHVNFKRLKNQGSYKY